MSPYGPACLGGFAGPERHPCLSPAELSEKFYNSYTTPHGLGPGWWTFGESIGLQSFNQQSMRAMQPGADGSYGYIEGSGCAGVAHFMKVTKYNHFPIVRR